MSTSRTFSRHAAPASMALILLVLAMLGPIVTAQQPADAAPRATADHTPVPPAGAPVRSSDVALQQPDGSAFAARRWGDGANHGWETADGYTVEQRSDGWWVYLTDQGTGAPGRSARTANEPAPTGARPGIRRTPQPTAAHAPSLAAPRIGSEPAVVILAESTNQANIGSDQADWNGAFFGATNSVNAYYDDQSNGLYSLTPAAESDNSNGGAVNDGVIGWVSTGLPHPDDGSAVSTATAVAAAITAADSFIDFESFDTNASGSIEAHELHITVIFAGYEAAFEIGSECGNHTWGHQWSVASAGVTPPFLDNVTVSGLTGGYTQFGEWHCDSNINPGNVATIGIMAHEFGHDIGLPDLYDIDGGSDGIGPWGIMSGGTWGTNVRAGDRPTGMVAWTRWFQGWLTPTAVSGVVSGATLDTTSQDNGDVYLLGDNPAGVDWSFGSPGTGEYFLIENRQKTGWDLSLPECGILITHIDETRPDNSADSRRIVDIEEAHGFDGPSIANTAWTLSNPNGNVFNEDSFPNSDLYSGSPTRSRVEVTSNCATQMTATLADDLPPGDDLAEAELLTDLLGLKATITGTNALASTETNEVLPAGDAIGTASIWYRWTAPVDGLLQLDTNGSAIDTLLTLNTGASHPLTPIAVDDDSGVGGSRISGIAVTSGTTYRIGVYGDGGAAVGDFNLNLKLAPDNDAFTQARAISGSSGSARASNLTASSEAGEPVHHANAVGRSVWFAYTAPTGGALHLDTTNSLATDNSPLDTVLAGYSDGGGSNAGGRQAAAVSDLTLLGSADVPAGGDTLTIPVTAGRTYFIAVDGASAEDGLIELRWDLTAPTVSIEDVTVAEESLLATVVLSLDVPAAGGESLTFATLDDTALADADYTSRTAAVTFANGQDRAEVAVPILDDAVPESSETIMLLLKQPAGLIIGSIGTITILDTDTPGVQSVAGPDRIETSVGASQATWTDRGTGGRQAAAAVIASSRNFPDALVGTPLAVDRRGPLLLTSPAGLDNRVADELERILQADATIYVLGGTSALAAEIDESLTGLGFNPVRVQGSTRFETAAAVADELGEVDNVLLATGRNFPDALAAGAAAAQRNGVVLLTADADLPDTTADAVAARPGATVYAVGGQAAAAYPTGRRLVGANRYETAAAVAAHFFPSSPLAGLASGVNFPDALSGGVGVATIGGPLLLTPPASLADATRSYLMTADTAVVVIYGGTAAVSDEVRAQVAALV